MDGLENLLEYIRSNSEYVEFNEVMELIDDLYNFTPTAFDNGELHNAAGENNGSCKLLAFGQMHQLEKQHLLNCFGAYYHEDVIKNPKDDSHQNIRNFIKFGWNGVTFHGQALALKDK